MEQNQTNETGNQVLITHTFNAPREAVFKAWTDPEQLANWFAPEGCVLTYKALNINEGGQYHSCIYNESFGNCWCKGTYITVKYPEKLVLTMEVTDETGADVTPVDAGMDADWPQRTTVTVLFYDRGDKTLIELHQTVSETLAKKTGAYPSWFSMFERMGKLL